MKANELRIGNLINYSDDNVNCVIKGIHEFGLDVETSDEVFYTEHDRFSPIPLTYEWLLRFGFEKSRLGYFTIFCGSNVMSIYCFEDFSRVQIVTQTVSTIKHVHQLQNLYFALTGEELTLKP